MTQASGCPKAKRPAISRDPDTALSGERCGCARSPASQDAGGFRWALGTKMHEQHGIGTEKKTIVMTQAVH